MRGRLRSPPQDRKEQFMRIGTALAWGLFFGFWLAIIIKVAVG